MAEARRGEHDVSLTFLFCGSDALAEIYGEISSLGELDKFYLPILCVFSL